MNWMKKISNHVSLLILVSLLFSASHTAVAEDAVGSVFLSFGENYALDAVDGRRVLKRNDDIFVDDRLFTSQNGQLQLRFVDGSRLALKPATEFAIVDFQFNPDEREGSRTAFNLIKGGMRTLSGKIGKSANDEYRMETLVATIGIRGTYYGVEYTEEGIYIETLWGLIVVTTKAGSFDVKTGQALIVNYDSGEVRYVTPTGQTAPAGFRLADQFGAGAEPGFTEIHWKRWTEGTVGVESLLRSESELATTYPLLNVDPLTSFNNFASKSGSYTYNYRKTISDPTYSDGTVTAFDSGSMTVDWGTQLISSFSIATQEVSRNSQRFDSTGSVSLETVLNGGSISVSELQTENSDWEGRVDIQFLGGDASSVGVDLNASDGVESLSGTAVFE